MLRKRVLCCLLFVGMVPIAGADTVFKCTGADGKVTWSNQPCPSAARAQVLEVRPNVVDSAGLRNWAARSPARAKVAEPAPSSSVTSGQVANPLECDNARRGYEFEAGYRYRKHDVLRAKAREVFDKCGYWP